MRRIETLALTAAAAALSACASAPTQPVPVEHRQDSGAPAGNIEHRRDGGTGQSPRPAPTEPVQAEPLRPAAGDSSRRSGQPAVVLPERPDSHVVEPGDTLFSLTERYQISLEQMIAANGLAEPYTLYVGQRLTIPDWPTYTVRPGDTVSEIAYAANVDIPSLLLLNYIPEPNNLRVGQVLILPELPGGGLGAPSPSAPQPSGQADAPAPGSAVQPRPAPSAPSEPVGSTQDAVGAAGRFEWPLTGDIISDFGPKGQGQRNDGVNIRAPAGSPVRAAADGEVVYAGNEVAGYGELLLVRHDGGWITAYAHNRSLLVGEGTRVTRGQTIAEVGQSGSVNSPQLHFEVRNGVNPVNPMQQLPPA